MSQKTHLQSAWRLSSYRLLLPTLLLLFSSNNQSVWAEQWTDLRGTRTIDARMVGMWGDNVFLELSGGRRISVNVNSLRADSRIQAGQLQRKLVENRAARIEELAGQREEAAAAGPKVIPTPSPAPGYSAPAFDIAPDQFMSQVQDAMSNGHIAVSYDSMPPSFRKDVDDLVSLAVAKMDSANFQLIVGNLQQFGDLLVTRQRWLMSSPRIANLPGPIISQIEGPVMSVAGLLRTGLSHELVSLEKLQSMPFGQWLHEFDAVIAPYANEAIKLAGGLPSQNVSVVSSKNGLATVKVTSMMGEVTERLKLVEGCWISENVAKQWPKMMEDARQQIETAPQGQMLAPMVMMAQGMSTFLTPLANAKNANDFHAGIESLIATVGPMAAAAVQSMAKNTPAGNRGYDDGMYGEEDMYGDEGMYEEGMYEEGMSEGYNPGDASGYTEQMMNEQQRQQEQAMKAAMGGR